jgi:trimeric autotransporter adhesin
MIILHLQLIKIKKMKKITLLILMLGFTSFINGQCLTSPNGQWPTTTYVPTGCDGVTVKNITTAGYTGEYSKVTVVSGETYTFASSQITDDITISSDAGVTAAAFGTGSVTWIADISGTIQFYTHLAGCGVETVNVNRTRSLVCGIPPTCPAPTALSSSAITSSSANIAWVEPASLPSSGYDYYYSTATTSPDAATVPSGSESVGVTTSSLTSLTPATTYYFWVRSNCGSEVGPWTSVSASFTTLCETFIPSYTQDFVAFPPVCWSRASLGDTTTGPTNALAGIWAGDGFLNVGTTGAARVNLYFNNRIGWLISPNFDLSAGGYRVKFNYGVTAYTATTTSVMGSDDSVKLVISEDNGLTWTTLTTFDAASNISNTNNTYTYNLAANTGANTKFALLATDGTVNDTPDYDFFVDNFVVETTPVCSEPLNLQASLITSSSATFSWVAAPSANSYEYVLDTTAGDPATAGTSTNSLTYDASGLSPATTYYFHVRTNCSNGNSVWVNLMIVTPALPPANDLCDNAITLIEGTTFAENEVIGTTVGGSTTTGLPVPTCQTNRVNDVWYTVIPTSATMTVETDAVTGSLFTDSVVSVFSGTCGALTQIGCDDDTGNGNFSKIDLTGLTAGTPIYISVYRYSLGTGVDGEFKISTYDTLLASSSFDSTNFSSYPNPVVDILNLSFSKNIDKVQVLNLLGQEVVTKLINATDAKLDMSALASGTYLVKVTADNQIKTIKVIKQ